MTAPRYAVVGGGIVGAAVAHRLLETEPDASVTVLEKESELAQHQTGRNSGVVHAGIYYTPGSLKAQLCRQGVGMLKDFCAEHDIAYREIGKVLVALDETEAGRLGDIESRAHANGVPGVRRLGPDELTEIEPHVRGVAGLHSPTTAIADFPGVTRKLAELVVQRGGRVRTSTEVVGLRNTASGVSVTTRSTNAGRPGRGAGPEEEVERFDTVVLCAGLHVDRLARQLGASDEPRIMPFRGEYLRIRPEKRSLVNGLVYPVPDPRYPFLGVHLTPQVDGEVLVGPNAVLALAREGYTWGTVSPRDLADTVSWPGFLPFARKNWRTGVAEMAGSLSRRRFVAAAQRYVPDLMLGDVLPGRHGIRAQAMDRDGSLVDDFRIDLQGSVVALRNAPSPAATSSLAIASYLVDRVRGAQPEVAS
ncbi:L-2-hydroxyglutarate oxidase [Ornithinimicrobium cavernae]|uniref:L-2-hydroxyglutarate oxidase n=1 Tax=Ornithinimicrobium cavernae TaxID=2666047 RepID=UPI000D68A07A|nr:L-2-hydroxyglutarate oxidase [Ornithinimicrobium cavernae]